MPACRHRRLPGCLRERRDEVRNLERCHNRRRPGRTEATHAVGPARGQSLAAASVLKCPASSDSGASGRPETAAVRPQRRAMFSRRDQLAKVPARPGRTWRTAARAGDVDSHQPFEWVNLCLEGRPGVPAGRASDSLGACCRFVSWLSLAFRLQPCSVTCRRHGAWFPVTGPVIRRLIRTIVQRLGLCSRRVRRVVSPRPEEIQCTRIRWRYAPAVELARSKGQQR